MPPERVFLLLFCVVEALNLADYAGVPRLEEQQKYSAIWYQSICQSPQHCHSARKMAMGHL